MIQAIMPNFTFGVRECHIRYLIVWRNFLKSQFYRSFGKPIGYGFE
ncbi:hypothetical protein LEP1GSC161_1046 [Leptospira santarosai str. CBC1416]|uniref:Uncharacterized protein n=1 Tax=Leptospira santarosai str. CBC1416 TaxID=1193059 RepID=M6W6P3_9LEPT|nr:hypothetical protein LEP1GSC161_1046 [Leptospira santarosai str. CBC1416]